MTINIFSNFYNSIYNTILTVLKYLNLNNCKLWKVVYVGTVNNNYFSEFEKNTFFLRINIFWWKMAM